MTLDSFFWWSGAVVWLVAGSFSLLLLADKFLDRLLTSLKLKRDFILWCFKRVVSPEDWQRELSKVRTASGSKNKDG